jgi:hypothetical protein
MDPQNSPHTTRLLSWLALRRARWSRRLLWALAGLALIWALLGLAVPPLLKWQLEKQGSAYLGRAVSIKQVSVKPWSLEMVVEGARVADASGQGEQLAWDRLYIDAELQSLVRLAPVLDAVRLEGLRVAVRHQGEGRYDIDDVLERLQAKPSDPNAEPARFALFNLELVDGQGTFTDEPRGVTHRLEGVHLTVPFLSNLASKREVLTQPRLAFSLNGSQFDSALQTTPFATSHHTEASLEVPELDVAPYLPYWPQAWGIRPQVGTLHLSLKVLFEQAKDPVVVLSGALGLSGLKVAQRLDGQDQDWLAWDRLDVGVQRLEPLARQVALDHVRLQAPRLALSRDASGRLNVERLLATVMPAPRSEPQPPARPGGAPWRVQVGEVSVRGGAIGWRDATTRPAAALTVSDWELSAGPLRWPETTPAPLSVQARLNGAPLSAKGEVSDREAHLHVEAGPLPLPVVAPYVKAALAPDLDGQAQAAFDLHWQAPAEGRAMALMIGALQARVEGMRLKSGRQDLAQWSRLQVEGGEVDLSGRRVSLGAVALDGLNLPVQRDAQGRWMAESWLVPTRETAAVAEAAPKAAPWVVQVGKLAVNGARVAWTDRLPATPVQLVISELNLSAQDLQPMAVRQAEVPLSLQARVASVSARRAEAGRLSVKAKLRLPSVQLGWRWSGQVQAERLPLQAVEPYVSDRLNLDLQRADASFRGQVDASQQKRGVAISVVGDAALDDVRASTLSPAEDLLLWKSLQLRGVSVKLVPDEPLRLAVAETVLSDYFARVIVAETGRINLQDLVKPAAAGPAPAAGASQPPAAGPAPDIRFGPISLVNGRVLFSDRFIQPNYSANLNDLTGGISAFSSLPAAGEQAPALADLSLRGRAEGTAALEITGRLNPLAKPLALDVKGRVRDLELPPLSPYSAKYAGYGIQRGKLSVDVAYRVEPSGQLTASNQIVLNQLTFGDRIEGSQAPNLPVKLAVALLADRHGVIDINLPISGSINDPQFRLGPIIVRLVLNLIGKAITSPFSLIASAFSGGGAEQGLVPFPAGRAELADAAREQLNAVAKALQDRPALVLTVVGQSDMEAERSAYQRARLDEQVKAEKRRALARAGGSVPSSVTVSAEEYPALLREVYRRADIPKPRNLLGMAKDIPLAEMEALLLAATPVSDNAMRELAVARAVAVKEHLAEQKVPEDRLFIGAPLLKAADKAWAPRVELQIAPR